MGSRLRDNPDNIYELFVEVVREENREPFISHQYPESNVDDELLKSVVHFAFPVSNDFTSAQLDQFTFVLTDIRSQFRFGYCRLDRGCKRCLCIVSYFPWFEIFYRLLNLVAEVLNRSDSRIMLSLLSSLYSHEVPRQGMFVEVVSENNSEKFSFTCPPIEELPSIPESRNLMEYCNAVKLGNMVELFASMLCERRIIVTCRRLSRMTACIHAACALMYPMNWQHLLIPAMPSHLLEYCSAPMPYIIGVHSSLFQQAQQHDLGDVVILNADDDEICSPHSDAQLLPPDVLYVLRKYLKISSSNHSLTSNVLGDGLAKGFLKAMVCLLGGYRDALRFLPQQPIEFDVETFVASRPRTMRPFLLNLLSLQAFEQFIADRLEMLNSGHGFKGIFETEANGVIDKLDAQRRYKEWIKKKQKQIKHEGKEIWDEVVGRSKKTVKDIRACFDEFRKAEEQKRLSGCHPERAITLASPDVRTLRISPVRPPQSNMSHLLGPSPLPRQLAVRRGTFDSIETDARFKTKDNVSPVDRFHSVRHHYGSFDDSTLRNVHTVGLYTVDDTDVYANWSRRRLSDIKDLSPTEETALHLNASCERDDWLLSRQQSTSGYLSASADDLMITRPTRPVPPLPIESLEVSQTTPSSSQGNCQKTTRSHQNVSPPSNDGCELTSTSSSAARRSSGDDSSSSDAQKVPESSVTGASLSIDTQKSPQPSRGRKNVLLPRSGSAITRQKAFYNAQRPLLRRPSLPDDPSACEVSVNKQEAVGAENESVGTGIVSSRLSKFSGCNTPLTFEIAKASSCAIPEANVSQCDSTSSANVVTGLSRAASGVYGPVGFKKSRNSLVASRIEQFSVNSDG